MCGIIDAAPLISIQKMYADFYQLRIWQNEWRNITCPLWPVKRVNISKVMMNIPGKQLAEAPMRDIFYIKYSLQIYTIS